jgi:sulfur carrier protein
MPEQPMQLTINGKVENLEVSTVIDVLKAKDIDPQLVAVEVNTQMIDQENLETTSLKEADKIEFLFFMGGGA